MSLDEQLQAVLARKRLTAIKGYSVVTDPLDYAEIGQVFPIYPAQEFFLDEIVKGAIEGASVLEVGVGSGVLSIGAVRAGAAKVTALEINPRAKNIAGFNIVMNGFEDRISIVDGAAEVFSPVTGRRFNYIFSNPPFEPTPPDHPFFYHSAAGPFGLDFIETMFKGLYDVLEPGGHLQIVTAAPGDATGPFMLAQLAKEYLKGTTRIVSSPASLDYYEALDWLPEKGFFTLEQTEELKRMAREKGITHSHLCVLHHDHDGKGCAEVPMTTSSTSYASPEVPFE